MMGVSLRLSHEWWCTRSQQLSYKCYQALTSPQLWGESLYGIKAKSNAPSLAGYKPVIVTADDKRLNSLHVMLNCEANHFLERQWIVSLYFQVRVWSTYLKEAALDNYWKVSVSRSSELELVRLSHIFCGTADQYIQLTSPLLRWFCSF